MNNNTIRLLLIGLSDSDNAALTSNLHRIGYASRMDTCQDSRQLSQALTDDACDLILLDARHSPIEPGHAAELISESGRAVPLILYGEQLSLNLSGQYSDIIASDDLERLALSSSREFISLCQRRELHHFSERLKQAEQRSELLLSQADEAIAYIADGMIIHVNEHFAKAYGYASTEDLECLPLIDLIASNDQDRIKNALKNQSQSEDSNRLTLHCLNADGQEFNTQLILQNAVYDEEDCIQLSLGEAGQDSTGSGSTTDPVTGFPNAEKFMELLADVASHGLGGSQEGAFLVISLDRFFSLRGDLGLANTQLLMADTAELLRSEFPEADFGRVGDDLLTCLLRGIDGDSALTRAKGLCKKAESRIIEIEGRSQHYSLTIGVAAIAQNPQPVEASELLDRVYSVCEQLRDEADNGGIGNGAALYVRKRQRLHRGLNALQIFEEARIDERLQLLFRPMICLSDEAGDHYEVSLELADQQEDEISGMEILSTVEKQGGSSELDRWLIMEATKRLSDIHPQNPHIRLIINLSCNVFHDKELLSWLGIALKASRLPAETLILQFNLKTVAEFLKPAAAFAEDLIKQGCQFAVHGPGNSSEQNRVLSKVSTNFLKIDNALAGENKLGNDALQQAISQAHLHKTRVIVPNVDSAATLATLWQLGPDFIQGDYVHPSSLEMDYDFSGAG